MAEQEGIATRIRNEATNLLTLREAAWVSQLLIVTRAHTVQSLLAVPHGSWTEFHAHIKDADSEWPLLGKGHVRRFCNFAQARVRH